LAENDHPAGQRQELRPPEKSAQRIFPAMQQIIAA
jgi:hypothetical protein